MAILEKNYIVIINLSARSSEFWEREGLLAWFSLPYREFAVRELAPIKPNFLSFLKLPNLLTSLTSHQHLLDGHLVVENSASFVAPP